MDERTMLRYVDELQGQIDRLKKMAGGGGSTKDYDKLNNRPKINNITLSGNKKSSDLKIAYNMTEAEYESGTKNPESIYFLQENAGTLTDSAYVNLEVADWTEVSGVYKQTQPFVFEVTPVAGWTVEDVSIETGIASVDSYEVTTDPLGLSITYAAETLPEYGITATVTVTINQPAGSTRIVKDGLQFGTKVSQLYTGSTIVSSMELSQSVVDFDMIEIVDEYVYSGTKYRSAIMVQPEFLLENVTFGSTNTNALVVKLTDATHLSRVAAGSDNAYVIAVYGVKF